MAAEKSKRAGKLTPADPDYIYLAPSMQQRLDDSAKPFDPKTQVWIADAKETFIAGNIVEEAADKLSVEVVRQDGTVDKVQLTKDKCMPMNPPKYEKTDDMSDLTHLNEAAVLYNLQRRYHHMLIYTYSGLFCVAINPYKWLPIYTDKMREFYRGKRRNEAPPHLYAISDGAYQFMLLERKSQSMLITGESGAGKTENTKKVIQYFALTAAEKKPEAETGAVVAAAAAAADGGSGSKKGSLEDQIVQANPVLEAYGNAKTVRNNNSSRFGKFIRIHFKPNWKIAGADVETYLLEKSRITFQLPIERNYHIFYQLLSDAFPEYHQVVTLTPDASIYNFINQGRLTVDGIDDKREMQDTDAAFDILGFTQEEKVDLFKGTGSICFLGNAAFGQRGKDEQAVVETKEELSKISELLGLDAEEFTDCLLKPKIKVGNDYVKKGQNKDQVSFSVAALAKSLYSRMFEWIVNQVNETLDVECSQSAAFIGVLDIAGFEIFELNTFEQLCINYTNERLQQFFNHHMFILEQEEYQKEGIEWEFIDFGLDLENTIALIEKKMGILSILEEECIVPKATDKTFLEKLMNTHMGKHPSFSKPKPAKKGKPESHFQVHHYAGTVAYNVAGWLFKNKDPINEALVFILKDAKNALVSLIFGESDDSGAKKKKGGSMNTISQLHRESLLKLMTNLQSTHPHFVRCLIPNEFKQSGVIDAGLVMHQLTCNGVLEGIRICRKGYPNRIAYLDFIQRYGVLKLEQGGRRRRGEIKDLKLVARELIDCTSLTDHFFKLGHTKLFFKSGVLAQMEEWREDALSEILRVIQASARQAIQMITFKVKRAELNAWRMLQRNIRSWCRLRDDPLISIRQMITGEMLEMRRQKEEEARLAKLAEDIAVVMETLIQATEEREAAGEVNDEFSRRKDEIQNMSVSLKESMGANTEAIEQMTKGIDEKIQHERILQRQIVEERQKLMEEKMLEEAKMEAQLEEVKNEKARMDMNENEAAEKMANMHGGVINVEAKNAMAREEIKLIQGNMTHNDDKIRRLIHEKRELWDRINANRQRHWGFRFYEQVTEGLR